MLGTALPVYLAIDGETQGPFTTTELSTLWRAGEIDEQALYWHRGMDAWAPAASFKVPADGLHVATSAVRLTTGYSFAQREIEREIDVISAEYVLMQNVWADTLTELRDIAGGRSATMQRTLKEARQGCLAELRVEAARAGADGVIGVALAYSPLPAGGPLAGRGAVMLVVSGTAVALGPPPIP